jgi:hypothetical protein
MRWVRRPLPRYEDAILLQGRGRYATDLARGARILRFLRSPVSKVPASLPARVPCTGTTPMLRSRYWPDHLRGQWWGAESESGRLELATGAGTALLLYDFEKGPSTPAAYIIRVKQAAIEAQGS